MKKYDFAKDNLWPLILRLSIPTCLSQAVMVLYSIIDRMFIGHIAINGDLALAGVGIASPVTSLLSSFAVLIGLGGAPLMAIREGHKEHDKALEILSNALFALLLFSIILTPFFLIVRVPLLKLFGASSVTLPYAEQYLFWYTLGIPFALLSTGLNSYLINQGCSGKAMLSVLSGAILNIVLDPIFIFTLNFGVAGGAIATVISQIVSAIITITALRAKTISIPMKWQKPSLSILLHMSKLGLSPFIIIATDSLLLILLNAMLQKYGGKTEGDLLITCATIIQSYHLLVMNPLGGITGGGQGLVSYNYGAGNSNRVKGTYIRVQILATIYTTIMLLLTYLLGDVFVSLFTSDIEIQQMTLKYLRIFTAMIIPLSFQYQNVDTFTALSKVRFALPLSLFRKLLFLCALLILPPIYGASSAFFSEPICDLVSALISTTLMWIYLPKILKDREEKGLRI